MSQLQKLLQTLDYIGTGTADEINRPTTISTADENNQPSLPQTERWTRATRQGRTMTFEAKDGAKLAMIVRCKVNFVRSTFTNTHSDEERRVSYSRLCLRSKWKRIQTETLSTVRTEVPLIARRNLPMGRKRVK